MTHWWEFKYFLLMVLKKQNSFFLYKMKLVTCEKGRQLNDSLAKARIKFKMSVVLHGICFLFKMSFHKGSARYIFLKKFQSTIRLGFFLELNYVVKQYFNILCWNPYKFHGHQNTYNCFVNMLSGDRLINYQLMEFLKQHHHSWVENFEKYKKLKPNE